MRATETSRKAYMRDAYSKTWPETRVQYGFGNYDKTMCQYICENIPQQSKLLDVAAGTGYPFADFFQRHRYNVFGIDIAPDLIELCGALNPEINCAVGDAENLPFLEGCFDCTYCLHATWYFPDLRAALGEMIRTTSEGGTVIFDIQNRHNKQIKQSYRKMLFFKTTFVGKLLSTLYQRIINKHHVTSQYFTVHAVPTYPEQVYEYLKLSNISDYRVLAVDRNASLLQVGKSDGFERYARLVFVLKK